jgi:hypothetical protein
MSRSIAIVTVACACLLGCGAKPRAAGQQKSERAMLGSAFGRAERAQAGAPHVQYLDVYELTLPLGSVSRSEEFWKRVDEQGVDIGTYDLLQKNGFRVGVAPAAEWAYFRAILDNYPTQTKKARITSGDSGTLELLMKKGIDTQDLFYLTDDYRLLGRTYDRCENLLSVTFQAAPRKPGQVRVTMCPLVRCLRGEFQITVRNEEREYELVRPERLYDLNLCCDVPTNGFLVVAPSLMAKWNASLGNAFLVSGGTAERFEHVLLMVPRPTHVQPMGPLD